MTPAPRNPDFVVAVRARAGAGTNRVGGVHHGLRGPALVVAVRARATGGSANEAIRRQLAQALDLKPSSVRLRTGHRGRDKLFVIDNPPEHLEQKLAELLDRGFSGPDVKA